MGSWTRKILPFTCFEWRVSHGCLVKNERRVLEGGERDCIYVSWVEKFLRAWKWDKGGGRRERLHLHVLSWKFLWVLAIKWDKGGKRRNRLHLHMLWEYLSRVVVMMKMGFSDNAHIHTHLCVLYHLTISSPSFCLVLQQPKNP